jgi:hypothetical protein
MNLRAANSAPQTSRYLLSAFALTFAFGIAMIANSQEAGDGTWFWYAVLFRHGERLYSHLQLALQPLFVIETAGFMALLGKGWLACKVPAVLHLAALSLGFISIGRYLPMPSWQKALLCCAAFFMAVSSVAYRFDDYHVLAELFVLYSIVVLLRMHSGVSARARFGLAALLGAFAALSFATRVNNGGALFVGAGIVLFCFTPTRRWIALLLFAAAAALTLILVVRLTGDSFHDYWMYTITRAAASKGGRGNILTNPLVLPWHTLQFLGTRRSRELVAIFLAVCGVWAYIVRPALPIKTSRGLRRAGAGLALILFPFLYMHNHGLRDGSFLLSVSTIATFLLYAFGIFAFFRWVAWEIAPNRFKQWNRLEILLIIPLGQLAAEALSTSAGHGEIYMPMATLFLLLPIAFPIELKMRGRSFLLAAATVLMVYGFVFRVMEPYRWWSFHALRMFVGRQWFMHPVYGPMVIGRDTLTFVQPVCKAIGPDGSGRDGSSRELLSLPFSFANYFCDVPPWHDYVQTWYDTSEKSTIDALMEQLRRAPPEWIFYERQPEVVRFHEQTFNGGRPIPHRYLDQLMEEKINDGAWKVVYRSSYGSTSLVNQEWLLIQTTR